MAKRYAKPAASALFCRSARAAGLADLASQAAYALLASIALASLSMIISCSGSVGEGSKPLSA
jgi:hypothetical protein